MESKNDVPAWVHRWGQAKTVVGISAALLVLCGVVALLFALPFLTAAFTDAVYQLFNRPSPVEYWKVVALSALLEVAVLGYVVLETLAYRHRRGGAE